MCACFLNLMLMTTVIATSSPLDTGASSECLGIQAEKPENLALDKSWTNGGPENSDSSQVVGVSPLTSRVTFGAERTGDYRTVFASLFAATTYERKSRSGFGLRLLTCDRL